MKRTVLILGIILAALIAGYFLLQDRGEDSGLEEVGFRLLWVPQAQFAGYIVAEELGYYEEERLDVDIRPAGPDLYPNVTVASGTDDIGIGLSNQVVTARSNGVPLITIAQIFQDSANRYVLKSENRIVSLQDLRGRRIGLWLGGDEAEFLAMLRSEGMSAEDVEIIPQDFSVVPFLAGQYDLSMVTVYNELNQIAEEYPIDSLQVLSAHDYGVALVGDALITTEVYLDENFDTVVRFLRASLRGWQYAMDNPEATVDILVSYNPELEREDQIEQLRDVLNLVAAGGARQRGIGYMAPEVYQTAVRVLAESGQIESEVDPSVVFSTRAWEAVEADMKRLKTPSVEAHSSAVVLTD